MSSETNYKKGQKLFHRCERLSCTTPVEITKVGRKWVYFHIHGAAERFLIDDPDRRVDHGQYTSTAAVWLSEKDIQDHLILTAQRSSLMRRFRAHDAIRQMDLTQIKTMNGILDELDEKREEA